MQTFPPLRGSKTPPPIAEVALKPVAHQSPREDYSTSMSSGGSVSPTSPHFEFYPVRPADNANKGAPGTGGLPQPQLPTHPQLRHSSSSSSTEAATATSSGVPLVVGHHVTQVPPPAALTSHHHHHQQLVAPAPVVSAPPPAMMQQGQGAPQDTTAATTGGAGTSSTQQGQQQAQAPAPAKRRQKRLERNRESARLSRRRRKQYLEVLEENVMKLSEQVDVGRRLHVSMALPTLQSMRGQAISSNAPAADASRAVQQELSRTSYELQFVTSFQSQQLKSLALPPSSKFVLWLSLQNEPFFRGGRASSERLSAARIGERMLSSGTDLVAPHQNMWPLFCNEVGLSYEQEEKVRIYQRQLLQTGESWLHRHTAFGAGKTMQSLHDAMQAVTHRLGQRERGTQSTLSDEQRVKLAAWSSQNKHRLQATTASLAPAAGQQQQRYQVRPGQQHVAANLYTINHQLSSILQNGVTPRAPPVASPEQLKKLSRRPLFESMGSGGAANQGGKSEQEGNKGMSRESSFASTGSLKRSMNEMSMDDDRPQNNLPPISPPDAQVSALPLIQQTLGHVKDIVPPPPTPASHHQQMQIPAPTPVASMVAAAENVPSATATHHHHPAAPGGVPTHVMHAPSSSAQHHHHHHHHHYAAAAAPPPGATAAAAPQHQAAEQHTGPPQAKHARHNSFLPPHLNVVPEEMWPGDTDDVLMSLMDEDWAIGASLEMEQMPS